MRRTPLLAAALTVLVVLLGSAGCSSSPEADGSSGGSSGGGEFPDVTEVEVSDEGGGTYTLDVTIESPYDSAERYADGWRVLDPDGDVLGEQTLTHDHAEEQPFTRTQTGLEIPDDVDTIEVEGHDTDNGYGGDTVTVDVPRG